MSAQKSENEILEINVGGVIHTTLWSTLEKSELYKTEPKYPLKYKDDLFTYLEEEEMFPGRQIVRKDPGIIHVKGFMETFLTGEKALRDSRGRHFIDANGRRFGYILDYLRGHSHLSDNVSLLRGVANDAERFEMGQLSAQIYSEIEDIIERRREERRQEYLDRTRKPPEDSPPKEDYYLDPYCDAGW